ncbi:MAG: hypothetical protein ACI835_000917 [Planctomycetota bacterium]
MINVDSGGVAEMRLDLTNPPSAAGEITSGSSWNFHFWYRDPAAGGAFYDLTDGLQVEFCH